jgi:DNA-binding CsgD family transcriptional regulator
MTTAPFDRLTGTELRIMVLSAQGCSNGEAGDRLFLSINTVKTHLARVFRKLAVGNKTEAVAVLMLDERFREVYGEPVETRESA